ncbi:MAG: hypothetical protein WCS94_19430 [Verrucomicrobiota bacterium]
MLTRRKFFKQAGLGFTAAVLMPQPWTRAASPEFKLSAPAEIEEQVRIARPLLGGKIPANLAERLGTTHYDGHYYLTRDPYLLEGAKAIHRLGMNVAKFWLRDDKLTGYSYNSNWQIPLDSKLVDLLQHPYFEEALALPFRTVAFEIFPLSQKNGASLDYESDFAEEEKQFHAVAAYLLKAYAHRDLTFILQHWEGDWMLRSQEGKTWTTLPPDELRRRCDGFARFLAARQRGVERARREARLTRAKVYHAAEVNRVWDSTKGIPTLTTHVLPHVALDLVSWSSYDGMDSVVHAWQGIELIRQHMQPSPAFGKPTVFIGEIGKPENTGATEKEIIEWWDRAIGVFLAQEIPWFIHWELYCNEPKDGTKRDRRPRKAEELRGFWLVKPDGSLGHAGNYLTALLKHAGGILPKADRLAMADQS